MALFLCNQCSQFLSKDNSFQISAFIDVENKEFTIPCEILDGCTAGGVIGADPVGTLRTLGGNSDAVSPDYTVSVILAYYLFAELPSHWTWLGATLIFASSYYVLYREAGSRTRKSQ